MTVSRQRMAGSCTCHARGQALVAAGMSLREAMPWANRAGGVVVGKFGTATVSYEELFA